MVLRAACLLCLTLSAQAATAIRDVTVVDVVNGALNAHLTVVWEGDRITRIGPSETVFLSRDTTVIDGAGKFLIPGLWDMHVHLWDKENVLPAYLAWGVTGVRDMGSDYARVVMWRNAIESGKAQGPHVLSSGPPVDGKPSNMPELPVLVATTPDEARTAFDKLYEMDVDFVKVLDGLSRDAYFALAEQARHEKKALAGHVPLSVTPWDALQARQASIEHFFGFGPLFKDGFSETAALQFFAAAADASVRITPTLVLWKRSGAMRGQYVTPKLAYLLTKLAKRTSVELMAGTDSGDPGTIPGQTLHEELEELVVAGLTPSEALQAATISPARFLGWQQSMGSIEPRKVADLVLLDANPLDDIRNTRKISAVFARGKRYTPAK